MLCAWLFLSTTFAQTQSPPFYETRAVWLATVLQDGNWPVTGAPAAYQEQALRGIIGRAHALGINTFYFQVVSRGDAMYRSRRLPWSALLKGAGVDPGFDPLEVAIDEAHQLGMELHAWFNVFRIGDTNTVAAFETISEPRHIFFARPDLTAQKSGELWLDPSSQEARAWLVNNVLEVVENYDIDGIHFDFLRYPQGGLDSDATRFQLDSRGFIDIADWRRSNVNAFAEAAFEAIRPVKPWVKIGATPLGNYRETSAWPGFWAYSDAYQESRLWLQNGWFDYLAPQIYFGTGTKPEGTNTYPSPDFTVLVNEWVDESYNRPIIAGIAAYKPAEGRFPAADLVSQIDASRNAGTAGHASFRFDHLIQYTDLIISRYEHLALSAPMSHRFEASPPSQPLDLIATEAAAGNVTLSWLASTGAPDDPPRSNVIFRRAGLPPSVGNPADILAVVDASVQTFRDVSADPGITYFYRVAARSALGALSPLSEPATVQAATSTIAETPASNETTILSLFPNPASESARLVYHMADSRGVELILYDTIGRRATFLFTGIMPAGTHTADFGTGRLANGVYQVVLRTANTHSSWPLMINR